MSDPLAVFIPLLNPNEPEAMLADLRVQPGQSVARGEVLCTLETTKSTAEVLAERSGYVIGLRLAQGQTARAGELLCYLAESPAAGVPGESETTGHEEPGVEPALPPGLRITQPGLALARQYSLDLGRLPAGPLVTESEVRKLVEGQSGETAFAQSKAAFDGSSVLIYGGGGHGKMLIDLLRASRAYHIAGIIDDGLPARQEVLGVPVLGGSERLPELYAAGLRLAFNAVGGIGNIAVRVRVFQRLAEAGFAFPTAVHPSAVVEPSASLAPGAQVLARAYVGSQARLGFGVIANTGCIISHDCVLGDYAIVSPGAILAGEVQIGEGALVGMGATINLQVKVGAGARIGNGATVKSDVPEKGVVRAGAVWPG